MEWIVKNIEPFLSPILIFHSAIMGAFAGQFFRMDNFFYSVLALASGITVCVLVIVMRRYIALSKTD